MALSVVYFRIMHCLGRPHYVWDEYLYLCTEGSEVRVTVCVYCFVVQVCHMWNDDKGKGEGETWCQHIAYSCQ